MRCETTNLEIETIYSRIINGSLNLQPNFQRGEVWSQSKKQKLIDSILRGWKIPPIHVVSSKDSIDEVLDGQQRLVAIRDFLNNRFSVDGQIQPITESIRVLNGLKFDQLPNETRRNFFNYSVIFVRLFDHLPEEPAELFYRLNQPTSLTSAEQRNAYMGNTRDQIKDLVRIFEKENDINRIIGFSNSRLAYDEVLSKFCYTLELDSLQKKITANEVSQKYRDDLGFSVNSIEKSRKTILLFINAINSDKFRGNPLSLSKATLFSWLIFISKNKENIESLGTIIYCFEFMREFNKGKFKNESRYNNQTLNFKEQIDLHEQLKTKVPYFEIMLNTYNQRASMGSTDSLSIIYRDIILHVFTDLVFDKNSELLNVMSSSFSQNSNFQLCLDYAKSYFNWGVRINENI